VGVSRLHWLAGSLLVLTTATWLQADEAKPKSPGLEGIWQGTLKAGAIELRLVFHFDKKKDGGYRCAMDSIDQGAKGLPFDEVNIKDRSVHAGMKQIGGLFEGDLSEDGSKLAGTWKQSGAVMPLTLKRVDKVPQLQRPQMPQKPYPYAEEEVSYENKKDKVKLVGTLTLPRAKGPFPAVLLITGSGPQDRDETIFGHKPFLVLADFLTRRGVAVLRVDDRGVGASTGSTAQATTANFADDVVAGIEFLKGHKQIDAHRIGLLGHSEGAIIAPMVASRSPDVAFIVLLAGTGLCGEEVMYLQGQAGLKLGGANEDQLKLQRQLQRRIFDVVRAEKDDEAAAKKINLALDEEFARLKDDDKKDLAEIKKQVAGQTKLVLTPWFRYFLAYDPRPALRKVRCPVLALNGEKDFQVDAKLNLKEIALALKEGGNKDFTTRELPGLNHLFQSCRTGSLTEYGAIEETIAPAALQTIADWILEHASTNMKGEVKARGSS
jgi:pimeloyl-ACP methyl ester carboxylesterase